MHIGLIIIILLAVGTISNVDVTNICQNCCKNKRSGFGFFWAMGLAPLLSRAQNITYSRLPFSSQFRLIRVSIGRNHWILTTVAYSVSNSPVSYFIGLRRLLYRVEIFVNKYIELRKVSFRIFLRNSKYFLGRQILFIQISIQFQW